MSCGLRYEEIEIGARWTSPARTVTETDVVNFACHTGDFNRLHVDHASAERSMFGKPIAHGLLGLAWVAGLGSHSPFVDTLAFVSIDDWKFLKPVFVGDTVHVVTEAVDKQRSGRKHGQVVWQRELVNEAGQVLQKGSFRTLVNAAVPQRNGRTNATRIKQELVG